MTKKRIRELEGAANKQNAFDPSNFNDPVAKHTGWAPAKRGGTNIQTHRLIEISPNRMEFRASFGAKAFYLSFLFAGIGVLIFFPFFTRSTDGFSFDGNTVIILLIALSFMITGSCLFYFGITPIVFDKQNGFFWKGRKTPEGIFDREVLKQFTKLKNIHALQLISEHVRSDKKRYYSYELNIVLKDSRRINIVDHGKKDKLQKDAETLSAFLGKPIWQGYD